MQVSTAPTFRDPDGSLRFEGDRVLRSIRPAARARTLEFLESDFCKRLQQQGDLVGAEVNDAPDGLTLVHPRIELPVYPWEWTASQWMAAAELTLRLQDEALDAGWTLKDATPLNVLFDGPRPVLVDILSFERRDPSSRVWLAYGQFMRTFLLPLLMRQMLAWPLALTLFHRDGYEPTEAAAALGWTQKLAPRAFFPITLPAWLARRESAQGSPQQQPKASDPELTLMLQKRIVAGLRTRIRKTVSKRQRSAWSEYSVSRAHYTAEQSAQKREWVEAVLREIPPGRLLDLGANTGEFSELASNAGAEVVALERDAVAAEVLYQRSAERQLRVLTLNADIARPTPAAGWENAESSALLNRLEGTFDTVVMLAVIHHLLLTEQIPMPAILTLCQRLTRRYLVLEWVPPADPMFQQLMRGRDELYGSLSENDLMEACAGRFTVRKRKALENGRVLLLLERC